MTTSTRKQICFQVSHPYRTLSEGVPPFSASPCTVVSFPSKPDKNFQILRHLHEKEIQTVVTSADKGLQTEVRVPCNRWTQTQLQEVEEDKANLQEISKDVLFNLQMAVEETAAVDPLKDEWGALCHLDKTDSLLQPLRVLQKRSLPVQKSTTSSEDAAEDDSQDDQGTPMDILNLQRVKKKILRKVEEQKAADSLIESPVQKFNRLYELHVKGVAENS